MGLQNIFDAAPPGKGTTRTAQSIQNILRAGSEHGKDKGQRFDEAYMCEYLLDANIGFSSQDTYTLTLNEFVEKVEQALIKAAFINAAAIQKEEREEEIQKQ